MFDSDKKNYRVAGAFTALMAAAHVPLIWVPVGSSIHVLAIFMLPLIAIMIMD